MKRIFFIIFVCFILGYVLCSCEKRELHDTSLAMQIESIKAIEELTQISDGIVYFGRDSCGACRTFIPILYDALTDADIKIYYFDTEYLKKVASVPREELREIYDEYKVVAVPILVQIVEGKVTNTFFRHITQKKII